nr:hypothetical protein Iba_chr04bCG15130 [Ipomoea batatas]
MGETDGPIRAADLLRHCLTEGRTPPPSTAGRTRRRSPSTVAAVPLACRRRRRKKMRDRNPSYCRRHRRERVTVRALLPPESYGCCLTAVSSSRGRAHCRSHRIPIAVDGEGITTAQLAMKADGKVEEEGKRSEDGKSNTENEGDTQLLVWPEEEWGKRAPLPNPPPPNVVARSSTSAYADASSYCRRHRRERVTVRALPPPESYGCCLTAVSSSRGRAHCRSHRIPIAVDGEGITTAQLAMKADGKVEEEGKRSEDGKSNTEVHC